ncbi:MAG TPA: cytochrome c oxidase subunit 3 [Nitriliruptorales bacterium]|nr:cytochrome c oxidase subunit 3 [Nitriliruptorales bacterium]
MAEAHAAAAPAAGHPDTSLGLDNRKLGMWVFLASECMFFGSLITTYLLYKDSTGGAAGFGPGPREIFDIPFTSVSSFVLLMSSLTMVLAHHAALNRDERRMRSWLLATAMLGTVFIGGQVFEFTTFVHEGMTLTTSPFSSSFFVLTGFHGTHVTIGILLLLGLYSMSRLGRLPVEDDVRIDMIALYWHFVDIVWIVIFTFVYLIPVG